MNGDFLEALATYRECQARFFEEASRRKIDNSYRRSGMQCRKALKRCRQLAAERRILWDTGDGARTFY